MFMPRIYRAGGTVLLLVSLVLAAGCARKLDDNQILQSVQSKIHANAAITGDVSAQSTEGVVTLNGQVTNDAARQLAAREAADVPGVRTVVNNLTVAAPAAATPAAPLQTEAAKPTPAPRPRERGPASRKRAVVKEAENYPPPAPEPEPAPAYTPPPPPPAAPAPMVAMAPPPPPLPPPPPVKHTLRSGTVLSVRLIDSIDSSRNRSGDTFRATLDSPIRENGEVVVPAGVEIEGRIVDASNAGRYEGHSGLQLELTKLISRGEVYSLHTEEFGREEQGRGKGTAETVGAGAVIGAIIGGIAGGGKGAAIGTISGAGAGGVARAAGKPKPVVFPSETVLSFRLQDPVTVGPMRAPDSSRRPTMLRRQNDSSND